MPIRIPADAKIVNDSRLTLIRVISTLYEKHVNGDEGLKAQVRTTLQSKKAEFAESDVVVAALRAGSARETIDPRKLHKLIDGKTFTVEQFLGCVTVQRKPLEEFLAGKVIDGISTRGPKPEPALYTEFKPGVEINLEALADQLAGVVAKAVQ